MREVVKFPVLPAITTLDFSSPADVCALVRERCRHMFGVQDDAYINEAMDAIKDLFEGRHPAYQPMDTAYHDISHTLQATLCLAELLNNRQHADEEPSISPWDFKRTLFAVLFHDIGYLKTRDDTDGTGAKYTHVHEKRSCSVVEDYLLQHGWHEDDIVFVQNLISATGPRADLGKIPFRSKIERAMGQAVCTADYVGQMSDPQYPDKLEVLFQEFEENFRYQELPRSEWPFASYEALLRATPDFWSRFVHYKMNVECGGAWLFLENPVTGENSYLLAIERNMSVISRRIARLDRQSQVAS
ncbi:hypothetical protein ACFL07_10640 [Pseudomonadota bacterium]